MLGQLLLHSVVILWLVQTASTWGYGAASGVSNGQGPQNNGNKALNGEGVGRLLIPSKGVGAQNGYGGYPTKGIGYGAAAGAISGGRTKGYGAAAGVANGQGDKPQGYGFQASPANAQQLKGNGYSAQTGGYGGQGTKGYGAAAGVLGVNGAKPNGDGAAASAHYGGTKGNGAISGPSNNNGARPGQGEAASKPMKGYGRPPYGAVKGPGGGMGAFRGLGAPQFVRNQGKPYNSNGFNGYGAQTMQGYSGGYGSAGLGLGSRHGHGGMKGPKQGYGGAAGVPNGQGAKPHGNGNPSGGASKPAKQGYGNIPNGYGAKPNGYGATRGRAVRPQPGYGNRAVPIGYGNKPNGYGTAARVGVPKGNAAKLNGYGVGNGAALGGYGGKLNGYGTGSGSKPQTTKGAVSPGEGAKALGAGYSSAGVPNEQLAKAAHSGYGMGPNGKASQFAGASNGKSLKLGGVLSPEQLNPAPVELDSAAVHQRAVTRGVTPAAPQPTSILVMVTQEKYQTLSSLVSQGKSYKQTPMIHGITSALHQEPTPEPAPMGPYGKGPKAATSGPVAPQSNPAPVPAAVLPEGYVTGSAVPEQKVAEADALFGVDRTIEGDSVPERTTSLKTKAVPELVAAESTGSITPEETLTVGVSEVTPEEANIKSQPEAGPDRLGVKGVPAWKAGGTGNRGGAMPSKGQGTNPDCDPSGVPNAQWMKIPRPGYDASAGYSNGGRAKANKPSYGAGGLTVPGLSTGYGASLGYPYAGKPKQPGYGQGVHLGAGAGNGNSYRGYGNGYGASVQPDYASLGQSLPTADGKSGGAKQSPYNGAPVVPAGLDGTSPNGFGLGPNGKLGSMFGAGDSFPFGGQTLGAEKSNNQKYGIGGLQFGGQPFGTGSNGAGRYGGLGAGIGEVPVPGKYGYGKMPYQAQPAGLGPETKSVGKYGLAASSFQPEQLGLGHYGKLGKYGGGEIPYAPQTPGHVDELKSSGKYANQGVQQLQHLGSASEGRPAGQYDTAGLLYQPLPLEPDSAGKSYVKGQVPTPAAAGQGREIPVDRYENVGYINGQVQPEVVAFPAAPTPSPTVAYPAVPSYFPRQSHLTPDVVPETGVEDSLVPVGTASLALDSAPATGREGVTQGPEQPDELQQQQLPRQIHIQQQLKLHFHPQDKSWRGPNNGKYELNGFFGNSGYQG